MKMLKRIAALAAALCLCLTALAEEEEEEISMAAGFAAAVTEAPAEAPMDEAENTEYAARDALIDAIIETGRGLYEKANGKLQRAHYAGDIYVCKNFTTYVFSQSAGGYRLAEYPEAKLYVPANLPAAECKPRQYGYCWQDVPAAEGNPFVIAAQFLYDDSLSKAENMEKAMDFMRQVERGDYFQMSAEYYYGVGAHSAVMIDDYDPETDSVHWMDSNMAGQSKNGIRYGKVQFDAVKKIEWWADAFCKKGRGATIYRLRDDIIRGE